MNTFLGKSKIQVVLEVNEKLHNLKESVREFVKYYDTDNKIFGLNEKLQPVELTQGFLSIESTYENLEDALDHIINANTAIQVLNRENNGRVYRIGSIKPLSECNVNENVVINIKNFEEL